MCNCQYRWCSVCFDVVGRCLVAALHSGCCCVLKLRLHAKLQMTWQAGVGGLLGPLDGHCPPLSLGCPNMALTLCVHTCLAPASTNGSCLPLLLQVE